MKRFTVATKGWRPAPLPFDFHAHLDKGNWKDAIKVYQAHPYHTPVSDTYELLRAVLMHTQVALDEVRMRFESRIKVALAARRRPPEQIEWSAFWNALNNGDSRTISMSLSGARVTGIEAQTAVAEACAVLLQAQSQKWHNNLVAQSSYATVTPTSLLGIALERNRPDVAIEMLPHLRLSRSDFGTMWPSVRDLSWSNALVFFLLAAKQAPRADECIEDLLQRGCDLTVLAEQLERRKLLTNPHIVATLVQHAAKLEQWVFVDRCMEHLVDIQCITDAALRAFQFLAKQHTHAVVVARLASAGIPIHKISVEVLEELRW